MSSQIEQQVADVVITALSGLVEVRTGEQRDPIPQSSLATVQLESQQLREPLITNLFDNKLKIALQMHYADKTTNEMDEAGLAIMDALTSVSLASSLNAYTAKLIDTKADVGDGFWRREYTLEVLAVDIAS